MSDITGGVDPAAPEFNEVPTGKYEVIPGDLGTAKIQRPDGSFAFAGWKLIYRAVAEKIVAELERARLDSSSMAFQTMTKVAAQRDALQVMYDGVKESLTSVGELLEAKHADVLLLEAELEVRSAAVGVKTARLKEAPTNYRINKVMGGWYFLAPAEEPENIYDFVVAEGRLLYSSMEEATDAAWWHAINAKPAPADGYPYVLNPIERKVVEEVRLFLKGYPEAAPVAIDTSNMDAKRLTIELDIRESTVGGSVFNDQGPLLRWPNRCTDGARDTSTRFFDITSALTSEYSDYIRSEEAVAAVVTEEKVVGWSVPASQWEITVRPSEKPLYRATRHLVYGEVARITEETMHAESLSLIRMKVLNWFRRQGLPAACVPDDSPGSVLETWL